MEDRAPHEDGRLYDHEDRGDVRDDTRERRRGPVADWGGDELFGARPARRSRPGALPPAVARTQGHGMSPHATAARERLPAHPHPTAQAREHPAGPGRGWAPVEIRDRGRDAGPTAEPGLAAPVAAVPAEPASAAPARNTMVISGRSVGARSRSRRSVPDHLGTRPDHTAAWAVGLGMLLILVAILTAGI